MTGTTCEIERSYPFQAKIPCMTLNNLIMKMLRNLKLRSLPDQEKKRALQTLEM